MSGKGDLIVDEFLRRFAASPIHVPQLERLLAIYGEPSCEEFADAVLGWNRVAAHPEAARIALELLVEHLQGGGDPVDRESIGEAILSVPPGDMRLRDHLRARLGLGVGPLAAGDGAPGRVNLV